MRTFKFLAAAAVALIASHAQAQTFTYSNTQQLINRTAKDAGSSPITNPALANVLNYMAGFTNSIATGTGSPLMPGTTQITPNTFGGVLFDGGGILGDATTLPGGLTIPTANLGTPTFITLTSGTGLPLSTGVTGVLPAANGGAGTVNGALAANGSGLVSRAACAGLSDATGACSAPYIAQTGGPLFGLADTSGATLVTTGGNTQYFMIGQFVQILFTITYPTTANSFNAQVGVINPTYLPSTNAYATIPGTCRVVGSAITIAPYIQIVGGFGQIQFLNVATNTRATNVNLSGDQLICQVSYLTN